MPPLKIKCSVSGVPNLYAIEWPDGWPVPRRGEIVDVASSPNTLYVKTVVWYPEGDDSDDKEPFAYIVLGPSEVVLGLS